MNTLRPAKLPHFQRLNEIIDHDFFVFDTTDRGGGKTYNACALAAERNLKLFVLTYRDSIEMWKSVAEETGATMIFISTYDSLRSKKGCQPKHGYLNRYDSSHGSSFSSTPDYEAIVDEGILFVLDECQKVKNESGQFNAVRPLLRSIFQRGGHSRIIFLSASLFEKEIHAINFFYLLDFMSTPKLFSIDRRGRFQLEGLQELIDNIRPYDEPRVDEICQAYQPYVTNKTKLDKLVLELFVEIISRYLTSAGPAPEINFNYDVGNGYYYFSTIEEEEIYIQAVEQLSRAVVPQDGMGHINFGAITRSLIALENAKLPLFERLAIQTLSKPNTCCIIFLYYHKSIDYLAQALAEFSPIVYDGRLSQKKSLEALKSFQSGKSSLFLGQISKAGVSLNLQDTRGDSSRHAFASSGYDNSLYHQCAGRIHRDGTQSDSVFRIVYGYAENAPYRETRILAALSRKTEISKRLLPNQVKDGVIFPGDYPNYIEDELQ